jgi:hypothetical protein
MLPQSNARPQREQRALESDAGGQSGASIGGTVKSEHEKML